MQGKIFNVILSENLNKLNESCPRYLNHLQDTTELYKIKDR